MREAGAGVDPLAGGAGVGRAAVGERTSRFTAAAAPSRSPSFSMRARSVLREMLRMAAVREMFQPVWSRVARRCARIASPNEIGRAGAPPGPAAGAGPGGGVASASSRCSLVMTFSSVRSATRSITFDSSRTLPGQE